MFPIHNHYCSVLMNDPVRVLHLFCRQRKSVMSAYGPTAQHSGSTQRPGYVKNVTTLDQMAPLDIYSQHNDYSTNKMYNQIHQQQRVDEDALAPYSSRHYIEHVYESPDISRREDEHTGRDERNGEIPQYFDLDPRRGIPTENRPVLLPHRHSSSSATTMPKPYKLFDNIKQAQISG